MTRPEVDHLFGEEKRGHRSAEESFGMGPGSAGFGDGTGVTFDSSAPNARVINASGAYLYYDGELIGGELSPRPPDSQAALIRQKLGDPDRVIHEREGVLWVYDRYQLTIDTHPKFAWHFRLGSGEWK